MYEKLVRSLKTEFGDIPDENICDCEMCMMRKYAKDGDYTECVQRLGKAALDAIEDMQSVIEHYAEVCITEIPRWIPVTERLPEAYTWVLVFAEKHKVAFDAFYDGAQWKDAILNDLIVTHWMPLPEPPKEDEA